MDLVILNDSKPRRLAFYLTEEEYLARRYPDRDFFFAWQVEPSVIIGRNQLLEKEINVDFCHENGVGIFRRKSGGGAVVADMNNIMFPISHRRTMSAPLSVTIPLWLRKHSVSLDLMPRIIRGTTF